MGAPPTTNPEQPISLERFVAGKDRDSSPVFSGRVAELRWLGEEVGSMSADWRDKGRVEGSVRMVTGCPGIGKTALMREFARRAGRNHLIVEATLDDFGSIRSLNRRARAQVAPTLKKGARAALELLRLDALGECLETLADNHQVNARGVLLLLDEAQSLDGEHKAVVHFLHTGSQGQPVFPVFFGLDDTRDSLERAGASRIPPENRLRLGKLNGVECAELLNNFERMFAVRTPPELKARLLADSDGFPQHLNSALRALGEEWLRSRGRAADLDGRGVLAKAQAHRVAYYRGRIERVKGGHDALAAELADAAERSPLGLGDLHRMARDNLRESAGLDGNTAYYEGQRVVESMIRAGVLSRTDEASYRTPIPSFLTWLREKYQDRNCGNRNRPTEGDPPL